MRMAFLSDVHGNLPALESCLDLIRRYECDRLVFLGDVFGYFPDAFACYALLMDAGAEFVLGNHEAMLLGLIPVPDGHEAIVRLEPDRERLTDELRVELASRTPFKELFVGSHRLLVVHGSPADPLRGYVYPDSDLSRFGSLPYDYVVMGNTHRAMVQIHEATTFVNVGSVGLPRDGGKAGSFGLFDSVTNKFDVKTFPLDRDALELRYRDVHEEVFKVLDR